MENLALIILFYPTLSKIPENYFIFASENYNDNQYLKLKKQEFIFDNYEIFSFIFLIFGCFMVLYGAYYNFFLIIQVTVFFYYIISLVTPDSSSNIRNLLFILLFSFISGILIYIAFKSNRKFIDKHIFIKKISLGAITGCFLNQIIFSYIYIFNDNLDQKIYYICFPSLIFTCGALSNIIPKNISFIPSSVISGMFFIKLSIDNLFSSFVFESGFIEKIIEIIVFIIFVILAFFYQIYHLKNKLSEMPELLTIVTTSIKKNIDITQDEADAQSRDEQRGNSENDNRNSINSNEDGDITQDNQIDDQDD